MAGFTRWLAEQGAAVEVVAAGPGAPRVGGLEVERVDGRGLFYRGGAPDALARGGTRAWALAAAFQGALAARVAGRIGRWDAAVSHWVAPSSLAVLAGQALRGRAALPHLAIAHSSDVWLLRRSGAGRAALRLVARRADLVYTGDHLARAIAGAPGRIVAMGAGGGAPGERTRGRRRFAMGPGPVALFLGRLVPVKGLDLLLASLPDGMQLIVAGDGPLRLALERNAPRHARFVGEVRGQDKADLLAACDLLVVPSVRLPDGREEGTPTVLGEALAAGLPIVATRTGGSGALLGGTGAALVVEPDSTSLRGALRLLLDEPAILERLAAAAARAGARHDWEHVGPVLAGPLLDRCGWPGHATGRSRGLAT